MRSLTCRRLSSSFAERTVCCSLHYNENLLRSTGVVAAGGCEFPSATLLVHRKLEVIPLQHLCMSHIKHPLSGLYVHVQREVTVHTEHQSSQTVLLLKHNLPVQKRPYYSDISFLIRHLVQTQPSSCSDGHLIQK